MDLKIGGLVNARDHEGPRSSRPSAGRLHILGEMGKGLIAKARADSISRNAPRITTIKIPTEKIRDVIGPGGKVIRAHGQEKSPAARSTSRTTAPIMIAAPNGESIRPRPRAEWIEAIVTEPEMKVGTIYTGKVVKTMDFGAFVNFMGSRDGLVHISELAPRRVEKTTDVVKIGDSVKVKLIGFDERGKVKLSMKRVDQETGADISEQFDKPREPRGPAPTTI